MAVRDPETFQKIVDLAIKSAEGKLIEIPGDKKRRILTIGGAHHFIETPYNPPLRNSRPQTVHDLAALYHQHHSPGETNPPATVWFDEKQVGYFPVEAWSDTPPRTREEYVRLDLQYTLKWGILLAHAKPQQYEQKAFVRWLKIDLDYEPQDQIVNAFRSLDFQVLKRSAGQVDVGRESLDRSITAQVVDRSSKPELIIVGVRPFLTHDLAAFETKVALDIELDAESSRIIVQAKPASLDRAREATMTYLRDAITAALENEAGDVSDPNIPVIYGSP
jgi:hypothetical protein